MNALAKTMLVGLALAVAGGTAASAQTLRDGVEAAWAINPEIASLAARREAIAARRLAAQSWFAGAPAITLSHVTDQIIVNKQQRATEGELSVPLWLPGEGTASEQLVDAELLRTDAQIAEAQLKVAGEAREAVYAAALAEGQMKIADQRVDTARELEADVARRERAGEVAALEHDLIRGEFLDAQAKARERRAELATARTNLLAITGVSIPATSLNEPLTAGQDLDAHPRLQAATRNIRAAQAALRLALIGGRLQAVRQAVARLRRSYNAGEIGLVDLLRGRRTCSENSRGAGMRRPPTIGPEILPPVGRSRDGTYRYTRRDRAFGGKLGQARPPHPLMAVVDLIDTEVAVVHRLVASPERGYCDAPETVLVGLGVVSREVFVAPEAAREPCVRAALLAHEGEHDRILGEAVPVFIQQQRAGLALELAELKRTVASDQAAAVRAFDLGLKASVAQMAGKFKEELGEQARQSIDSASRLAELRRACNGRLGKLEKSAVQHGQEL